MEAKTKCGSFLTRSCCRRYTPTSPPPALWYVPPKTLITSISIINKQTLIKTLEGALKYIENVFHFLQMSKFLITYLKIK